MLSVDVLVGVPLARQEGVLFRDDLAVEERRQRRELEREAGDLEVAAQERVGLVDVLEVLIESKKLFFD